MAVGMMRQVHHVQTRTKDRWITDPELGMVKRTERIIGRSSTETINMPDGRVFEIGPDGTFDLPDDVAQHFLRMPGWYEGANPFFEEDDVLPAPRSDVLAPKPDRMAAAHAAAAAKRAARAAVTRTE